MRLWPFLGALLFVAAVIPTTTFLGLSPAQIWNNMDPAQDDVYRAGDRVYWDFSYNSVYAEYLANGSVVIHEYRFGDTVSVEIPDYKDCRTRNNKSTCIQWMVKSRQPVTETLPDNTTKTYYGASYWAKGLLQQNSKQIQDLQDEVQEYLSQEDELLDTITFD